MAEIHDLIVRLGRAEARRQLPDELLGAIDPADPRQVERLRADWERRVDWASDIMTSEHLRRTWLHSGFCLVALPHTRPASPTAAYSLKNGNFKLILTPKPIDSDGDGNLIYAGLPYGSKARLILVYLQTWAIRHKTRNVVLGENMTSWIRRLGFDHVTGGERGVITAVNEQARRISRTEFTMIWDQGQRRMLRDQALVKGLELFAEQAPPSARQISLLDDQVPAPAAKPSKPRRYSWVREIELSEDFYEHLTTNKVVLAEEAIARLKGSSWALDIYLWLSYRLRSVERETAPISWQQLREQFSPHHYKGNMNVFRTKVIEPALRDVQAVYPEARFKITDRGVVLLPSGLPVPVEQHVVRLPQAS
jgi:hypothetical protein